MRYSAVKQPWLVLALVALIAGSTACGGTSVENEDPRPASERNAQPQPLNSKVFLTAAEFAQYADDGATVIDARPTDKYSAGHYPGAVNTVGGKAWKDDNGILIPDVVAAQQKVRDLGIDLDRKVVIYGGPRSKKAGRLMWTLEYYGHGDVYWYPDGYPNLKTDLEFTEQTDSPDIEEGDFVLAERESVRATADEVQQAIDGDIDAILIDTRRETEFNGTEDRGDPRQGFIPGASWFYFEEVYDDNDRLLSADELKAQFQDRELFDKIENGALAIPYCQTGTRSATIYAIVRKMGYETQNYDGSWVEWSDSDHPIEQPQNQ